MGVHSLKIAPLVVRPTPKPRTYEKPSLLPGVWLEGINGSFSDIVARRPSDPTITEMHDVLVLDFPAKVKGLLDRLQRTEAEPNLLDELSQRHGDLADCYADHPLEVDVETVTVSCILAGATTFILDCPVLAEMAEKTESKRRNSGGWMVSLCPAASISSAAAQACRSGPPGKLGLGGTRPRRRGAAMHRPGAIFSADPLACRPLGRGDGIVPRPRVVERFGTGYLALTTVFEALVSIVYRSTNA
jgi:hypothetical protein